MQIVPLIFSFPMLLQWSLLFFSSMILTFIWYLPFFQFIFIMLKYCYSLISQILLSLTFRPEVYVDKLCVYGKWKYYTYFLCMCLCEIEDYTEDIAMFANSWLVQTPDDNKCVPTPSDFPNPCSSGMPAFEVNLI